MAGQEVGVTAVCWVPAGGRSGPALHTKGVAGSGDVRSKGPEVSNVATGRMCPSTADQPLRTADRCAAPSGACCSMRRLEQCGRARQSPASQHLQDKLGRAIPGSLSVMLLGLEHLWALHSSQGTAGPFVL
jgi:hypothetical protein